MFSPVSNKADFPTVEREILAFWPEHADAWLSLGTLHDIRGDLGAAETAYRRAAEFDPGHAVAYNNLGRIRAMQDDLPGAVKLFKQALEVNPANRDALNNLAVVYRHALGDTEQAEVFEDRIRQLGNTSD